MKKSPSYVVPADCFLSNDRAANLAFFLMENAGGIFGKWSGRMSAADQRAIFGRFLGKGFVTIDGSQDVVRHTVSRCFGTDFETTACVSFRDLN